MWWWAPVVVAVLSVLFLTVCMSVYGYVLRATADDMKEISVRSPAGDRHHWTIVEAFEPGHYCNVCGTGAFRGARCDYCGIVVDPACIGGAKKFKCKQLSSEDTELEHHWVQGNLSMNSVCDVCKEDCGHGPGLRDYKCCWCQRAVHTKCKFGVSSTPCDMGKYKSLIVPPNCVRLKIVGWKGRRHCVVREVVKPNNVDEWRPLIVVANRKSGNGEGDFILQTFRRLLNPVQVLDLADVPPEVSLSWCRLVKPADVRCRILVAGGDGTVGWILSCIEKMKWPNLDQQPDVRPLPLGTGNDLSRVLGWGPSRLSDLDGEAMLNETTSAKLSLLDRWLVRIDRTTLGIRRRGKQLKMSNYASIGVDALVTLNMHRRRYTMPRVMSGRLMNKILFFTYGTKDVLERGCKHFSRHVSIRLDDGPKLGDDGDERLPDLEGIVILNIPSWGGGVRLYELGYRPNEHPSQAVDDGKLEVLGLYSSFHIAQLQVGLSEPYRIGQAHKVEITIRGAGCKLPMQIDGEPWTQGPATITVTRSGQARLLSASRRGSETGDGKFFL